MLVSLLATCKFVPFWVILRRLSSNCRRFGTHCLFHLHRQVNEVLHTSYFIHLPMKIELIVSSETSAIRTQTPGNYPKRNKLHLEHGESLKTRILAACFYLIHRSRLATILPICFPSIVPKCLNLWQSRIMATTCSTLL